MLEYFKMLAIEPVQSFSCGYPHIALVVLLKIGNGAHRQTIIHRDILETDRSLPKSKSYSYKKK
jgi:hypothetical protein